MMRHHRLGNILFLLTFIIASKAQAKLVTIDLEKELKNLSATNAFDVPVKKKLSSLKPLMQVKVQYHRQNFSSCAQIAKGQLKKAVNIQEWIALTYLRCANFDAEEKKSIQPLVSAVNRLKSLKISSGPWDQVWAETWSDAHEKLVKQEKTVAGKEKWLETWAIHWDLLSGEQKSLWFEAKANTLVKDPEEAAFYLQQANQASRKRNFNQRISELLKRTEEPDIEVAPALPDLRESEAEADIQNTLKGGDPEGALKKLVKALSDFPQGKYAKKQKNQVLEIYYSLPKDKRQQAVKIMIRADESRLLEWAQSLHRRADYEGALNLSVAALDRFKAAEAGTQLLWIAGRSAHFIGDYDKATGFYDELVRRHSNSSEAYDALFRMALISYRQGKYLLAANLFERVRAQKQDRHDLNAWYWQVRSLEKANDEKATLERDLLIERFPFSYYGLRLRGEKNQGKIEFAKGTDLKKDQRLIVKLLPHQHQAWKRFKTLSENGWVIEAQSELELIPQPVTSQGQWRWIEILAKSQQFRSAMITLNRLQEQDPDLRSLQYMPAVFPQVYGQWIEAESNKYGIDPVLIRSLIRQESAFTLRAVSTSDAMGLMQMIPPTADEIAKRLRLKVKIPYDMYRPDINIQMGTFYVADMLKQFHQNVPMALGAYNAGPYRLKLWLDLREDLAALKENHKSEPIDEIWFDELPWSETSFYIKAILRNIIIYQLIDKGPVLWKPVFWSDLILKKSDAAASSVVK